MNKKGNRRARDTDKAIIRAFYQLLDSKKSVAKVSVREICEAAEINRSTFYAHYIDVYDLLEKVEQRMEEMLTETFMEKMLTAMDIGEGFIRLFEFVREHRGFYRIYLAEANHPTIGIAKDIYKTEYKKDYSFFGFKSEEEVEYQEDFFLYGLTAMMRRWIADDCKLSPQELLDMIGRQYSIDRHIFDWKDQEQ